MAPSGDCADSSTRDSTWPFGVNLGSASGVGAVDHRPRWGSELLRRRFPCHESSAVAVCWEVVGDTRFELEAFRVAVRLTLVSVASVSL